MDLLPSMDKTPQGPFKCCHKYILVTTPVWQKKCCLSALLYLQDCVVGPHSGLKSEKTGGWAKLAPIQSDVWWCWTLCSISLPELKLCIMVWNAFIWPSISGPLLHRCFLLAISYVANQGSVLVQCVITCFKFWFPTAVTQLMHSLLYSKLDLEISFFFHVSAS